jgi:glycosyltransferase involved in cell wall biosynthesis
VRIGIDARAAAEEPGGRGRYVRELLRHLAPLESEHEFLLYGREPWPGADLDGRFRWVTIGAPDPLWHVIAGARASRATDVYLSTNSYLTVWFLRVPSVSVVQDLVAFDRSLRPRRRSAVIERVTLPLTARRGTAFVCSSESTRRDLVSRFPATASKAEVVHLAADASFARAGDGRDVASRHRLERPYVLLPGTLEPRKNMARTLQAFAALPGELRERYEVVTIGAAGWETGEVLAGIAASGVPVRSLGYVPDEDLPGLYAAAELVAYVSIYEGFGLPVLEALAAGTAVLTADVSSLPEVGGDAVYYADPRDVGSIRDAFERLLSDDALRAELAARGPERASRFTWARTAAETVAALERAAAA